MYPSIHACMDIHVASQCVAITYIAIAMARVIIIAVYSVHSGYHSYSKYIASMQINRYPHVQLAV